MAVTAKPITLEQFLELPEEEPALEFFEGCARQKVSPKGHHSRLQFVLAKRINDFAEPKRLAMVFTELRATYGGASFVPDVSVYRWDRVPRDEPGKMAQDFREPPDIAVEIVSPGQSTNALIRRCLWYIENGVTIALLADPNDESVFPFGPMSCRARFPDQIALMSATFCLGLESPCRGYTLRSGPMHHGPLSSPPNEPPTDR